MVLWLGHAPSLYGHLHPGKLEFTCEEWAAHGVVARTPYQLREASVPPCPVSAYEADLPQHQGPSGILKVLGRHFIHSWPFNPEVLRGRRVQGTAA